MKNRLPDKLMFFWFRIKKSDCELISIKRKRMYSCAFVFSVLFYLASSQVVFAGAWVQPEGKLYAKTTMIYSDADRRYNDDSNTYADSLSEKSLYLYLEYGIFDRTSLILAPALYKDLKVDDGNQKNSFNDIMAGDIDLHLKYQFLDDPVVMSCLAGATLPMSYDEDDSPAPGTHEEDYDVKLLIGKSFWPRPCYISCDFGYSFRGGDYEDEVNFNFEAGYTLYRYFLVRILANGLYSIHNADTGTATGIHSNDQEQTRVGGGIIFLLSKNVEIDISFFSTIAGMNVHKSNETYVGIAIKY